MFISIREWIAVFLPSYAGAIPLVRRPLHGHPVLPQHIRHPLADAVRIVPGNAGISPGSELPVWTDQQHAGVRTIDLLRGVEFVERQAVERQQVTQHAQS